MLVLVAAHVLPSQHLQPRFDCPVVKGCLLLESRYVGAPAPCPPGTPRSCSNGPRPQRPHPVAIPQCPAVHSRDQPWNGPQMFIDEPPVLHPQLRRDLHASVAVGFSAEQVIQILSFCQAYWPSMLAILPHPCPPGRLQPPSRSSTAPGQVLLPSARGGCRPCGPPASGRPQHGRGQPRSRRT